MPGRVYVRMIRDGQKAEKDIGTGEHMKDLERALKAVADKNRLRIMKMLQARPMCVCELRAVLGVAQPTVSKHLKVLKDAGLITDEQDGMWTNYRISSENGYTKKLIACLRDWLGEDETVIADMKKAARLRREMLCPK